MQSKEADNMDKNSSMYKTVLLGVVSACAGLLLSAVNAVTAPVIADNALKQVQSTLENFFPNGEFTDVTDKYKTDDTELIDGVYEAKDEGYVFTLHNTGYSSDGFKFAIAFDNDGNIVGYEGLSNSETAGKGDKLFKDDYANQVIGLTSTDSVPIISGATVTSDAIKEAAKEALKSAGLNPDDYATANAGKKEEDVTKDADIVVVGAGGAGMTAAIVAANEGKNVVVVESQSAAGGNSVRATGGMNAAKTPYQDENTFEEMDSNLQTTDPLQFEGYTKKIALLQEKTKINEAVKTGIGKINGEQAVIAIMDGNFLMGSMGCVVGEKITRAIETAIKKRLPLIMFCVSGGARMQEGIISLMQMAKTSSALAKLDDAGLLYISVLTDPTTGGVTASFAMLGDIILAEPDALIGFAGPRVIEQTLKQKLPEGFQRSEFLLEHGFIDKIVTRKDMKDTLSQILKLHKGGNNND